MQPATVVFILVSYGYHKITINSGLRVGLPLQDEGDHTHLEAHASRTLTAMATDELADAAFMFAFSQSFF